MGTITRGTKAGTGTTDFGSTTALSSEVNTDFNTLVNVVNGNLDANNLAANAVTTTKITDLNVTTGKIADLGVTTGKINDLAVTVGKIAVLASVNAIKATAATAGLSGFSTVETDVAVAASITVRGGWVFLIPSIALYINGLAPNGNLTLRWYRDASVVQTYNWLISYTQPTAVQVFIPVCLDNHKVAGSFVYKLTAQADSASIPLYTPAANQGSIVVVELA